MNKTKLEVFRLDNEDVIATSCNTSKNHFKLGDTGSTGPICSKYVFNNGKWKISGDPVEIPFTSFETNPPVDRYAFYVEINGKYVVCDGNHIEDED